MLAVVGNSGNKSLQTCSLERSSWYILFTFLAPMQAHGWAHTAGLCGLQAMCKECEKLLFMRELFFSHDE